MGWDADLFSRMPGDALDVLSVFHKHRDGLKISIRMYCNHKEKKVSKVNLKKHGEGQKNH